MLRVCSNGVHFQNNFSLYLKHLLRYSTSTSATATGRAPSSILVDFMVESLGFSNQEAKTLWSKVSSSKLINSKQKPNLVVDFFKQRGLNITQIKKLISCRPQLLKCNVEKTLVPKFNALEDMGVCGTDIAQIIASNALFLRTGVSTKIAPMISFIKLDFAPMISDKIVLKILRRSSWLIAADVVTKLEPNIVLLRKYGLSDKRILSFLSCHGQIFLHDPKKLEDIIIKVNEELKVPLDSASFPNAVSLVASIGDDNREAKFKIFKNYGWTDKDILTMFGKIPRLFAFSENNIRERLEYFVNELGIEPGRLRESPYAMTYSMNGRILPRYTLLQGLRDRNIITVKVGYSTAICISEPMFLKKFVLPYKDEAPELCKAYTCRVKRTPTRRWI